jgi:hypothetical protein
MKKFYCSNCKEEITSCDSGYGHSFIEGEAIICKKKPKGQGSLHFCDDYEMEQAIVDQDIPVRTFGEEATVITKS